MDSQPVADPNAETLCPFDAADSGGQIRAQKASVGGFMSEPPHSRQAHVDGGGCEVLLFEEEPIAKNDSAVKGQTRFGTVPPDEFVDGMTVRFRDNFWLADNSGAGRGMPAHRVDWRLRYFGSLTRSARRWNRG